MTYEPATDRRSDAQLLRAARNDPDAFGLLYDRYVVMIHRWFAGQVADLAADLTAETFAQAWISRGTFQDLREGSAAPWLFGIGRNVLVSSIRRQAAETRARERLGLQRVVADDPYQAVDDRLSITPATLRELRRLPEDHRRALEMRVVQELGYDEIAEALGASPTAARARVSRGLRRMRRALAKDDS